MGIHVIIGADDYLVAQTAKRFVGDGIGLEVIDSINSTNAELQLKDLREAEASLMTPPFLDPKKVTWWKNVHFLPGGGKKQAAEDVDEALKAFAARLAKTELPENQSFILSGPHLLKTSLLAKTLAGAAEIVQFAAGSPREQAQAAIVRVIDAAKELGLTFASGSAEKFVARVGPDMRSLMSELGKMRDYLGNETSVITPAAIDEVTSQGVGVEPEIWAITDAIGERNTAKALGAVHRFEEENGFAVLVTTVVEKFFRQMLDVSAGRTEGLSPFAVKKMSGYLNRWKPLELRRARGRFMLLREKSVSSSGSVDVLVTTELVRALRH